MKNNLLSWFFCFLKLNHLADLLYPLKYVWFTNIFICLKQEQFLLIYLWSGNYMYLPNYHNYQR